MLAMLAAFSISALQLSEDCHLLNVKQSLVRVATPQCWTAWFIWARKGNRMNSLKIYLIDKIDGLGKSWLTLKGSYNKAYILQFDRKGRVHPTKLIVSICKKFHLCLSLSN